MIGFQWYHQQLLGNCCNDRLIIQYQNVKLRLKFFSDVSVISQIYVLFAFWVESLIVRQTFHVMTGFLFLQMSQEYHKRSFKALN